MRVLVIDDDEVTRDLIQVILETNGHDVFSAEDGVEGLESFASHNVDVVITDIFMPKKEGMETIMEIKNKFPDFPIIAISHGGQTRSFAHLQHTTSIGATVTLPKPFNPNQLLAALEEVQNH